MKVNDYILQSRLHIPVVTGKPSVVPPTNPSEKEAGEKTVSFRQVLNEQLAKSGTVAFSKHAAARVQERNIVLTENSMERLNEGVRIAQEKGLNDTLIIVDSTAFIVNVKNGMVITTLGGSDLRGNAITNINGTVIV